MGQVETRLKQQARDLGFELVGIARAGPADGFEHLESWLARDFAGEMEYMHRHAEARRHPASILSDVRSVIMTGMNYLPPDKGATSPGQGRVAYYARGEDYHHVLRRKLNALLRWLQSEIPGCQGRGVVDTAPLLERDFARRAGLGWFGKNTMLLNKGMGSYFFLGALLVNQELQPDPPHESTHCGTCTACLDACPTEAFIAPFVLDARRCISYLTIELKGPVPDELRPGLGDWLFGCDVCQDVCPWNRKVPPGRDPALQPRPGMESVDLVELLGLYEEAFRLRFRDTAFMRSKRRGLLRNAALVLGNQGNQAALPALRKAAKDPDPLIRDAAEWAIARIQSRYEPDALARVGQDLADASG